MRVTQHLIPLSDLSPTHLEGARLPLVHPQRPHDRWELIDGVPHVRRPGQDHFSPAVPQALVGGVSLDCADRDVARWLDSKVARWCLSKGGRDARAVQHLDRLDYRLSRAADGRWTMSTYGASYAVDADPDLRPILSSIPATSDEVLVARKALAEKLLGANPRPAQSEV